MEPAHGVRSCLGKQIVASWREKGAPMLGFLFGFNARLGRLQYFLATDCAGGRDDRDLLCDRELCLSERPKGNASVREPDGHGR